MRIKHIQQAHQYEIQREPDSQFSIICKGELQEGAGRDNTILHGYWKPLKTDERKKGIESTQ